jgi:hypothetical protein
MTGGGEELGRVLLSSYPAVRKERMAIVIVDDDMSLCYFLKKPSIKRSPGHYLLQWKRGIHHQRAGNQPLLLDNKLWIGRGTLKKTNRVPESTRHHHDSL